MKYAYLLRGTQELQLDASLRCHFSLWNSLEQVVVSKKNRCRFDWIIGKKIRLCTEIFNNTKIHLTLNIIKWKTKINQIRKSYTNLHLFNIQSRIHNLIFKNIYSFLLSRRLYYGNHHLFKNIENNPKHSHVNQYYFSIL